MTLSLLSVPMWHPVTKPNKAQLSPSFLYTLSCYQHCALKYTQCTSMLSNICWFCIIYFTDTDEFSERDFLSPPQLQPYLNINLEFKCLHHKTQTVVTFKSFKWNFIDYNSTTTTSLISIVSQPIYSIKIWFSQDKYWVQKILSPKKLLVWRKFWIGKEFWGWKKKFSQKSCGSEKILGPRILRVQKKCCPKEILSKTILGQKIFGL